MKFILNENLPKFILSEKFILNEDTNKVNELKSEIDSFNNLYNIKKEAIITIAKKLKSAETQLAEAKNKFDTLQQITQQATRIKEPDLTVLWDRMKIKNQEGVNELPEIREYLLAISEYTKNEYTQNIIYFSKQNDDELNNSYKNVKRALEQIKKVVDNYKKEVERNRQKIYLQVLHRASIVVQNYENIIKKFIEKLQENYVELEKNFKPIKEQLEKFEENKDRVFNQLKKETDTKIVSNAIDKIKQWINKNNNLNLTTVNTVENFLKLINIINSDIENIEKKIKAAQITKADIATTKKYENSKDWDKAFANAAHIDANKPSTTTESESVKVMQEYLDQEWHVNQNTDIKRAITEIYDSFTLELEAFGYNSLTNPFVDYLHYAFDEMKAAKDIAANPVAYSALHEAYRKSLIDDDILRGKWPSSDKRINIIFCNQIFNLQREDIYKYLEYQLASQQLFNQLIEKNPNNRQLIIDKYSNKFNEFFVDLFYKDGNTIVADSERIAGTAGPNAILKDLNRIEHELFVIFGDKETIAILDGIRASSKTSEKITKEDIPNIINKIFLNRPWSKLYKNERETITNDISDLSSTLVQNLKDNKIKWAIKKAFETANQQGLNIRSLNDTQADPKDEDGIIQKLSKKFNYNFASLLEDENLCQKLILEIVKWITKKDEEEKSAQK